MIQKTVATFDITIYIAGDADIARQVCREYCFAFGLCVTVESCWYVYTGGEELGVRIGLLNYPRFPTTLVELRETAVRLAENLRLRLCQHSYLVVCPEETVWVSYRPE